MPIYEYGCAKCGHQFEVLVRAEGDIPLRCPTCGGRRLAKAFSSFAVASVPAGRASPACSACPASGTACPGHPGAGGACPITRR
ncbi:MAG: zinc ribbon domain-containing protein [Kiritimatiellae bacterium]|nr:zinc ribbon domain-containing protein [Kiritimatiellia bacterium]